MNAILEPVEFIRKEDRYIKDWPIQYAITDRAVPDSLLVLMPAALGADRENRGVPHYTRWSWANYWPTSKVLTFADPAMQAAPELDGAWYVNTEYDFIQHIARVVDFEARQSGIPSDRILFYGSSLGGFGAIACAAHLTQARAIADVPQIDVEHWEDRHVKLIEKYILKGPISRFRKLYPERLNLISRLEFAGRIPNIRLVTNPWDSSYDDQLEFFRWIENSSLPSSGIDMLVTTRLRGHTFFDQDELVPTIVP